MDISMKLILNSYLIISNEKMGECTVLPFNYILK